MIVLLCYPAYRYLDLYYILEFYSNYHESGLGLLIFEHSEERDIFGVLKLADKLSMVMSGQCVFGLVKNNATVTTTAVVAVEGIYTSTVISVCDENCFDEATVSTVLREPLVFIRHSEDAEKVNMVKRVFNITKIVLVLAMYSTALLHYPERDF